MSERGREDERREGGGKRQTFQTEKSYNLRGEEERPEDKAY